MVLSIGMIVKNEEKYLEQCLTALKPILDKLDSELIIADTGSTDRTVEIAKKFTDNVFHFEWIDDFAAARNSTLEHAKGEWYMFIDADEVLQDCSDIISFFKTGEYKKYNSATYIVRSYADLSDKESYLDINSQRLVAISNGAEFQGKIHEVFTKFYTPIKFLDLIADHYGYAFFDNGVETGMAGKKSARNLELLLDELNNNEIGKERCNIYNQIADCYEITEDFENTLKYLDIGLEKVNHHSINIVPYYSNKISVLSKLERFDEVVDLSNEYFDIKVNPFHTKELASDCYIRAMRGYAYYKRHEYSIAIRELVEFFNLYRKYCNGKLNTEDIIIVVWRTSDTIVQACYDIFFRCCYQEKQFALAGAYTEAVPLSEFSDNENFMENHLKIRVEIMENVGYNKLDALYRQLDERWKSFLLSLVRPRVFKAEPKKRGVIIKKLTSLDGAPSELAKIYNGYFEGSVDFELIRSYLEKYGTENGEDLLLILTAQNLDLTPFVRASDFFADRAVQLSLINYAEVMTAFEEYDISATSNAGLEGAVFLYYRLLLRVAERGLEISKTFEKFSRLGARWIDAAQSNSVPMYVAAALLAHEVVEAHNKRDRARFRKAVDELKRIVPDYAPVANAYSNEVNGDFNSNVSPEFVQLAIQVKQNIRGLIASRNIGEARKLIKEYAELCPNDPEIEDIKNEINSTLQ